MTISACSSNLAMPLCVQSQVQVDPSLMVTPSYTQTLLDSLSSKPNDVTPK
ncbi:MULTISPECIES: Rz1-like spanin outer membrane subunit [Pseudomonas]|uniref:Rz1-like spanin outer membrane subunit n=1 Tax=Pseudomonas TaxID=286 RepID=UPI00387AC95B